MVYEEWNIIRIELKIFEFDKDKFFRFMKYIDQKWSSPKVGWFFHYVIILKVDYFSTNNYWNVIYTKRYW